MPASIARLFDDGPQAQRHKMVGIYALLVGANAAAWLWALVELADRPVLIGTALLAYVFGLRHAVDADHIAAIDNVVRKLMQDGKYPLSAGFFFSLGHSTVVVVATILIAGATAALSGGFPALRNAMGLVGTGISAFFLMAIAAVNLVILRGVWRNFQAVRRGGRYEPEAIDALLSGRGLLARLFRPLFAMISTSWHMYPLGFLFGLGFDTATEIGLLGLSAAQVADGMSLRTMLVFPALFTAGMALVDTTDGAFMVKAYGWAFANPVRKLWYNVTITAASVLIAVLIGSIEVISLLVDKLALTGSVWRSIADLNDAMAFVGGGVVAVFVLCWIVSALIYRWKRLDALAPART